MLDTLSLVVLVVSIVLAFVAQRSLTLDAEHEAEHQRERATDALRACAGLRYDLTVARSSASEAAAARTTPHGDGSTRSHRATRRARCAPRTKPCGRSFSRYVADVASPTTDHPRATLPA